MANEKNLKKWKKGQSGNPKGRPKKVFSTVLDSLKKKGYEKVSKSQVREAYEYLVGIDEKQLKEIVTDAETPMLFRVVGKEILSKKGFEIIEKMLDRAHGKAMQSKELAITGDVKLTNDLSILSDKDLDELERITAKLEAGKSREGKT